MRPLRASLTGLALLSLLSVAAHGQQWGGSPPARTTSRSTVARSATPANSARSVRQRVALVDPNAYAFVFGAVRVDSAVAASGGSWNGTGVQWGGAPPSTRANQVSGGASNAPGANSQRRPLIAAANSPVPGSDQPRAATSTAARTRAQQYLMERGKP